jgi:hypothetical protein
MIQQFPGVCSGHDLHPGIGVNFPISSSKRPGSLLSLIIIWSAPALYKKAGGGAAAAAQSQHQHCCSGYLLSPYYDIPPLTTQVFKLKYSILIDMFRKSR